MRLIGEALGSTVINPLLLTCAGASIKEVTRRTSRSRKLVHSILLGTDSDVLGSRGSILEPHLMWLAAVRRWLSHRAS
jgi:hypothetical protein